MNLNGSGIFNAQQKPGFTHLSFLNACTYSLDNCGGFQLSGFYRDNVITLNLYVFLFPLLCGLSFLSTQPRFYQFGNFDITLHLRSCIICLRSLVRFLKICILSY